MDDKLVTVATYWMPFEAHFAKNRLEQTGIPALLANELTVDMIWTYANATGGIRVQVPSEHAARAEEVLAAVPEPLEPGATAEWNDEMEQGVESCDDAVSHASDSNRVGADSESEDKEIACNEREHTAQRAFKAAIFGLVLLPLQFWVFWLLVKVFFSNEPLAPKQRWQVGVAAAICLPIVFVGLVFFKLMLPW